jgi:hypothetical protein
VNSSLAEDLLRAGLVQFGLLGEDEPVRLRLDLLPSYPDLLRRCAVAAAAILTEVACDRLICLPEAAAFGVAVSLETGIPLVYSSGSGAPPTLDLVGAYDVSHPAVLLALAHDHHEPHLEALAQAAGQVGLVVTQRLSLIDQGGNGEPAVLRLDQMVDEYVHKGLLPPEQARSVLAWITRLRRG